MGVRNLHSLDRKKYKRAVNSIVRTFNKDIKNDWLWNGRFEISQEWSWFQPFHDHSGGLYMVGLVMTDKKTGDKQYAYFDNYEIDWKMWEWANKCITEIWDVWSEEPNPNKQARLEGRQPPEWK